VTVLSAIARGSRADCVRCRRLVFHIRQTVGPERRRILVQVQRVQSESWSDYDGSLLIGPSSTRWASWRASILCTPCTLYTCCSEYNGLLVSRMFHCWQADHDRSILGGEVGEQSSLKYGVTPVKTLKFYGLVRGGVHQSIYFFYYKLLVRSLSLNIVHLMIWRYSKYKISFIVILK